MKPDPRRRSALRAALVADANSNLRHSRDVLLEMEREFAKRIAASRELIADSLTALADANRLLDPRTAPD